ncbi:MAG: hypothetical protein ACYDHM_09765 [Acidiferrobacterales bacterium]
MLGAFDLGGVVRVGLSACFLLVDAQPARQINARDAALAHDELGRDLQGRLHPNETLAALHPGSGRDYPGKGPSMIRPSIAAWGAPASSSTHSVSESAWVMAETTQRHRRSCGHG